MKNTISYLNVLVLATFALCAGCLTVYESPSDGPSAAVRFRVVDDRTYHSNIIVSETKDCASKGGGTIGNLGTDLTSMVGGRVLPDMIGSSKKQDPKIIERIVRADESITVGYHQT